MPTREKPQSRHERREQSRQEQRRQQRQQELARQKRRQQSGRRYIIGGIVVLLLLLGGGAYFAFAQNNGGVRPGAAIDGINCESEMLSYHIHANLTLYQNGKPVIVPAGVGIPANPSISVQGQNSCLYWLHTHNPDGILHIESPTKQLYTLGQFFDIWHYTALWDSQSTMAAAAGFSVDGSFPDALRSAKPGQIRVYVGGKYVGHDYKSVTLTAHELITVELGTPLKPPTTKFNFGSN